MILHRTMGGERVADPKVTVRCFTPAGFSIVFMDGSPAGDAVTVNATTCGFSNVRSCSSRNLALLVDTVSVLMAALGKHATGHYVH
jgi:hypothetical protein